MKNKEEKNTKKEKRGKRVEIGKHFIYSLFIAGPGWHLYSTRRKC